MIQKEKLFMYQRKSKTSFLAKHLLGAAFLLAISIVPTMGQGNFQSGSTGADGAFNPTSNQTITVPESGVFNFTTVNIPNGITITFAPNSKNSPVTILTTGDVVISGIINVAGQSSSSNGRGGLGGPGGFAGGNGGYGVADLFLGINGSGPGGGRGASSNNGTNGSPGAGGSYAGSGTAGGATQPGNRYGSGLLQPIIGGSGGGGGAATPNTVGGGGGGGGGAIVIASSSSITLNTTATIDAKGGSSVNNPTPGHPGGGGSGGAIRLIANTLSGSGTLSVAGGNGGFFTGLGFGGNGGFGYIRAEAFNTTAFTPSTPSTIVSISSPSPVVLTNQPSLRIVSVATVTAPQTTTGSLVGAPDIVVPSTQTNPVSVVLEGRNLPSNVLATLTVTPATGTPSTTTSSAFSPTSTPGVTSANASVSLPSGISVISAVAAVDLALAKTEPMFIDGEKIDRIEVTAVYGGDSKTTYITASGKKIIR